MKICRHLKALLWKRFLERRRRIYHTLSDIFCGVLMFVVLVLLKQVLYEQTISSFSLQTTAVNIGRVLYSPDDHEIKLFMGKVAQQLHTNGTLRPPVLSYRGFRDPSEIIEYLKTADFSEPYMVINFQNVNFRVFPKTLNYTIRFTGVRHPYSEILSMYPQLYDADSSVALANFQWVIDKVYLESLSGREIDEDITLDLLHTVPPQMRVVHSFLILCTCLAPLPFYLSKASKLVVDKRSGLNQLTKLAGVASSLIRTAHLADTAVIGGIYAIIVTILLKMTSRPILVHSQPFPIIVTLLMHFLNLAPMACITSSLSQDVQHADSISLILYLLTFLLDALWYSNRNHTTMEMFIICCVLPHAPVYVFWDEVTYLEKVGDGIDMANIIYTHSYHRVPVIIVWMFFLIQHAWLAVIAWYFDATLPGPYGPARGWWFLCTKSYWQRKKKKVNFHVTVETVTKVLRDARFFDKEPQKARISIKVANVTKVYESSSTESPVHALDSVTLNAFQGEITVLVGMNGAGKSTLLSIVAGMLSPTDGTVYVNGLDTNRRFRDIREQISFCPQWNVTYDYLTVRENIMFFGRLRNEENCYNATETLLHKLKIGDKADNFSVQLSTGTLRCLQVACTMVMNADVIVLDEPTSGMDSRTRHAVWDLLLVMRGIKTILMATTLMEEADVLADRIAILHNGKLKSHGTPPFLKDALGSKVGLAITVRSEKHIRSLHQEVKSVIKDFVFTPSNDNRIVFLLPAKDRDLFPKLFDILEAKRKVLQIITMDIGMSIESLFLKFIHDDPDDPDVGMYLEEHITELMMRSQETRLRGVWLWKQQIIALVIRAFKFLYTKKLQFALLQLLVPLIGFTIVTLTSNSKFGYGKIYEDYTMLENQDRTVLLYDLGPVGHQYFAGLRASYPDIQMINTANIQKDVQKLSKAESADRTHFFGYKVKENRTTIYYPTISEVSVSKAINIHSNIYRTMHQPFSIAKSINMMFEPLDLRTGFNMTIVHPKKQQMCFAWSMWISFLIIVPMGPLILISIEDYMNGVRYRHMVARCSPLVIWFSQLSAHYLLFLGVIPLSLLIIVMTMDFEDTFDNVEFVGALITTVLTFAPAYLVHLHSFSFCLHMEHAISQIYIMSLVFGLILPLFIKFFSILTCHSVFLRALRFFFANLFYLFPAYSLTKSLTALSLRARANAYCRLNRHICPNLQFDDYKDYNKRNCCDSNAKLPFSYYSLTENETVFTFIFVSLCQFTLYSILLILLTKRIAQNWTAKLVNCAYRRPHGFEVISITQEKAYVSDMMHQLRGKKIQERSEALGNDVIIVEDLHKNYVGCGFTCNAVKGISFAVKKGECLGLLGPNGAGKTTALRMIWGRTVMTRGDACIKGYFVNKNKTKYINELTMIDVDKISVDSFLTGLENLKLLSILSGRSRSDADTLAVYMLQYMGLFPFAARNVSRYSHGCARRLSTAGALAAGARAALLDEPTAGLDPHSRPLVMRAIRHLGRTGTTCVMAENSLKWRQMESVCSRIAIMVGGKIVALGSVTEIREQFAPGYMATLKLKVNPAFSREHVDDNEFIDESLSSISMSSNQNLARSGTVDQLKSKFQTLFEHSELLDEHFTMLYYRIWESQDIMLSKMFTKLEKLKGKFSIIEDYTIGETPLEEVFCQLRRVYESDC